MTLPENFYRNNLLILSNVNNSCSIPQYAGNSNCQKRYAHLFESKSMQRYLYKRLFSSEYSFKYRSLIARLDEKYSKEKVKNSQ